MDPTASLLSAVAGGDRVAYRELIEKLGPYALALATRVTRNRALAEEAVQDAFTDVWMKASKFDRKRGGVRQWVMSLVHNKSVDVVRREASANRLAEHIPEPSSAPDPEQEGILSDRRRRIENAVRQLSEVQREAIELAYFDGLTYRQVAERLQVPEGTAKSRLRDGLITLRGLMDTAGVEWKQ